MKNLKDIVSFVIFFPISILRQFEFLYEKILKIIWDNQLASKIRTSYLEDNYHRYQSVIHKNKNGKIFDANFYTPNHICQFRVDTFSSKEPEMLEWIDEFGKDAVFYDIGANIGLYSVYFAKMHPEGFTYAFEPSVFNVAQIAKNISLNNLQDKVNLIPNPLSASNGFSKFIISSMQEGGALNAFGVNYGYDGNPIENKVEFGLLGFSLDKIIELGIITKKPTMIKIDVDGIEHLILKGGEKTLKSVQCKTILIEVNDNFSAHQKIKSILKDFGFYLRSKQHSDLLEKSTSFNKTFNQIWVK